MTFHIVGVTEQAGHFPNVLWSWDPVVECEDPLNLERLLEYPKPYESGTECGESGCSDTLMMLIHKLMYQHHFIIVTCTETHVIQSILRMFNGSCKRVEYSVTDTEKVQIKAQGLQSGSLEYGDYTLHL